MPKPPSEWIKLEQFFPSLQVAFQGTPLNLTKIILAAVPVANPQATKLRPPDHIDRRSIFITDGNAFCAWEAPSLRELFRGDRQPPVLGDYPSAYNECFALLDLHALEFSRFFGDRRDEEMKEIYSMLRRRPDGKSLGFLHDYMWQAAAIVLGTQPLSQAEFEAIMARLERSCRTFERGPTSRNYIAALRQTFNRT